MPGIAKYFRRFLAPPKAATTKGDFDDRGTYRQPADREDVANCYRLLLGREPESSEVVAAQVGKPIADMLRAFLGSDEFRGQTHAHLMATRLAALYQSGPDASMLGWLRRRFLADVTDDLSNIQDTPLLLAACIRQPRFAALVDECLGRGEAARLATAIHRHIIPRLAPTTSEDDVRNCYRLLLQREPESERVAAARPGSPLLETIINFIESPEFADRVAYPAMDCHFSTSRISDATRKWAAQSLYIADAPSLSYPSLVAACLAQPTIARALIARKLDWPAEEVIRGLEFVSGKVQRRGIGVEERLAETCRDVHVVANSGMKLSRDGHAIQFTDTDPWVVLHPSASVLRDDLIKLRFRVTVDGRPTQGHLYFDLGSGFSHRDSLALRPDAAGFQNAVIATPRKMIAMRWDPAACGGLAVISLIEAEPISAEAYLDANSRFVGSSSAAAMLRSLASAANVEPEEPLGIALARLLSPTATTDYGNWILQNEPQGQTGRARLEQRYAKLDERPLISVIVPTYNTPPDALARMIDSVRSQVYGEWELCIADDASTLAGHRELLAELAALDPRIHVVQRDTNGHICAASNSALEIARGEWIAMLDHDDELTRDALLEIAVRAKEAPDAAIIYSDEDKLDEHGTRFSPYFKPDFSPALLLAQNYFNHLTAIRRSLVVEAGGWRPGFEGSQDHDLILRVIERIKPTQIQHIPAILYHWRAIAGSTALENDEKNYVLSSGEAAVREHLNRTNQNAAVETMTGVHHYRVRYALPKQPPLVSLIIPTRDKADVLQTAIESILEKSTYKNYEILVVDNGSTEKKTKDYFASLSSNDRVRIENYPGVFNFSAINNFGANLARGSILGLVNNDVEVITPDWIEEMTSWALQKDIGCVGAKLCYSNETIQHAGVIIGLGGVAGHSHKHSHRDSPGYFNRLRIHQNMSAVTAACLMVRREVFEEVDGLDEQLAVAFNDVDFCLRVREAGYRNLFTPFAELYHHESVSRGAEDNPEKIARFTREVEFMKKRWKQKLDADPYYSPNLTYDREDFSLNLRGT